MNKHILSFSLFEANASTESAKFSFTFPEGKYKREDIPTDKLEILRKDLIPIFNQIKTPTKANLKTVINLVASTSKKALSPELKKELESSGFKSTGNGNDALANARLKTLEDIMSEILVKNLGTTLDVFKKNVQIAKTPKPNSGEGESFQYISSTVDQTGDPFPEDKKMGCNVNKAFKGVQGQKSNNFVGYSDDLWLPFPAGQEVEIEFFTYMVPDCVYIKYGDQEFLSGFVGNVSESLQEELTQLNQNDGLVNSIQSVMKSLGSNKTVRDLDPKFIEPKATFMGRLERFVRIKEADPQNSKFTIKKKFGADKLYIRVFSPLDKTMFKIKTICK
jgi:hypothetical protein